MPQVQSAATSSTNFKRVFRAALEAYNKQTRKDIASHPLAAQLRSCESPSAVLAILRAQVQAFDRAHCADERLTKWLDPTVNVLYAFSTALGNGVGLIFPPSNVVFAGIGILLQAVQGLRASQDALVDLFGRIEYFFKRLEKYMKVRPTVAMTDIIVKIMIEVLSILGIVTKEVRQGRTKRYLKELVGRKDLKDALQRLDQLTQEEVRMAAAEALTITRGIDDNVKDVNEKVEGVDKRVQSVDTKIESIDDKMRSVDSKVQDVDHKVGSVIQGVKETGVAIQHVVNQVSVLNRNELRKDFRRWVATPDPSVNYNAASGAHHEGTAVWCTKGNTLADWKTSGSLLWIHGKPGSGKSILSSVIIRDIKSMSNAGLAHLAYFYFDFKDTEKQDSRELLSSLLVQLSDQSDIYCAALFSLYSAHNWGSEQPTVDSLWQCLKYMLTTAGQAPIYLILDALDECPNLSGLPSPREKLLDLVDELVKLSHPTLRVCATSRPEFDISTALEPLATHQVSLHDESGQKQDIVDYVTAVVRSDRRMKRWRDEEKNAVIEKLAEKADGMFRWVFCQLEVLRHCFPTNVRRVLEELPKSLDETYERILKEINNANREHSYRLLQCLMVAARPLRVEELAELLAFDFKAGGIAKSNAEWRWEDQEEAVMSACSSLVTVIISKGSRVVQFSHFSVKEFLISDRLANSIGEVSRFHIPIGPSHAILAQACLGVLLRLDDRTDKNSIEKIPLVRYAAEHWIRHAQSENVESRILDAMDCFFDTSKPHFSAWVRIHDVDKSWWTRRFKRNTMALTPAAVPLYYAALCGFRGLVERLLKQNPQHASAPAGRFGTPLHATLFEEGHIEVAKLIIESGADVNALGVDKWTPLHFASRFGHLDVARWLLDLHANANSKIGDGWTSLHLAAANQHIGITQLLLERGAEVNARGDEGSTPLHEASRGGAPDIVRLLLGHNADPRVRDNGGDTPLHLAASSESLEVSQILLASKAEINAQNNDGSTPLHRASACGYLDLVRLLLDHGADANARDNRRNTPLHLAATNGNLEAVRILLDSERNLNVEVNARTPRNDNGSTPLHKASENGHPDIVRLLLDHAATDAHVRDNSENTPLHLAAANGNLEAARILLECHAEVNARNNNGSTPLHRASKNLWRGYPDVVRLLLEHDADAHVRDHSGSTPSEVATGLRRDEIVELLSQFTVSTP